MDAQDYANNALAYANTYATGVSDSWRKLMDSPTDFKDTLTGVGQAALSAGSGTLKALNSAANRLLPGDANTLAPVINSDPVMNYQPAANSSGAHWRDLLGSLTAPIGDGTRWANNRITAVAGAAAAGVIADATTLLTGKQAVDHPDVPMSEMTAYHGTPHVFPATDANPLGEFDLSKMGTGEGAQAYGHGIYVAQNLDVAKNYMPRDFDMEDKMMAQYKSAEKANDVDKMQVYEDAMLHTTPTELRARYASQPEMTPHIDQIEKLQNESQAGALYHVDVPDEHIDAMMDWDRPLNQQTPTVKKALGGWAMQSGSGTGFRGSSPLDVARIKDELVMTGENDGKLYDPKANDGEGGMRQDVQNAIDEYSRNPNDDISRNQLNKFFKDYPYDKDQFRSPMEALENEHGVTTGDLYQRLAVKLGGQKQASQYLLDQGVPGIKYLDAGSRAATPINMQKYTDKVYKAQRAHDEYPTEDTASRLSDAQQEHQEMVRADRENNSRNLVLFNPSIATITHREGSWRDIK